MIAASIIFLLFGILPLTLLIAYPTIKPFGSCISKCFTEVANIRDKVYGCYTNGLEGTRDTRIFAAFHFILRLVVIVVWTLAQKYLGGSPWLCVGMVFMVSSLIIALIKPYNQTYMNVIDCLILSNLSTTCYVLSQPVLGKAMLLTAKVTIVAPIVVFSLMLIFKKCRSSELNVEILEKCRNCFPRLSAQAPESNATVDENQQLISPTSSVVGYN